MNVDFRDLPVNEQVWEAYDILEKIVPRIFIAELNSS